MRLDDRNQRTSVESAQADLARDQAQLQYQLANVGRQPSLIAQQDEQAAAVEAQLGLARANAARYRNLASTGAGTVQSRQAADAQLAQLEAQLRGERASARPRGISSTCCGRRRRPRTPRSAATRRGCTRRS